MMLLDALVILPVILGLAIFFMDGRSARPFALGTAALQFVLALALYNAQFEGVASFHEWVPAIGLNWSLAIDGANGLLILLTPLITGLALMSMRKVERTANYAGNLVLMNGFLTGLFLAQNLGLFYIFFEAMLLPALMLVAGWSRRQGYRTAVNFLMFTLTGSLPMLLSVLMLAFQPGPNLGPSLEFADLGGLTQAQQVYLFFPFLLAFLIKMPMVPFHGWLPPLYSNAPAPVVVVIAALMSKAGTYGLMKVGLTVFPKALALTSPYLIVLAVISILYGALSALGANSLREVLAFSSMSHIAMIGLGIFAMNQASVQGATLQMGAHAVATGGLFLALALMERRNLPDETRRYGGLARHAPRMAALVLFLTLASLGQPGLGSFPAELLILTGTWHQWPGVTLVATLGIILAAAYLLRWYQLVFTGEEGTYRPPTDLTRAESLILIVPISVTLFMGFVPSFFLYPIADWVAGVVSVL